MSDPKYAEIDVYSHREVMEITNQLRNYAGCHVSFHNGRYTIRYDVTETTSYYTLERALERARSIAQENIRYVDAFIENEEKNCKDTLQRNNVVYQKSIRVIDEHIRRLESLLSDLQTPISSSYGSFTDTKQINKIQKQIEKYYKEKETLTSEKQTADSLVNSYLKRVRSVKIKDDIYSVSHYKPKGFNRMVDHSVEVEQISNETNTRLKNVREYSKQLDEVASIIRGGELSRYDARIVKKVSEIDPFDGRSLSEIKNMLNGIFEEVKFIKQEEQNQEMMMSNEQKVLQDLESLMRVSKNIEAISVELSSKEGVKDASEVNNQLIEEINKMVASLKNLDYLSNSNSEYISAALELIEQHRNNIASAEYTSLLQRVINEMNEVVRTAVEDNKNFNAFQEEMSKFNTLVGIIYPEEKEDDIDQLSSLVFNPRKADESIEKLKKQNEMLTKVISDIQSRAYVTAATQILEEEGGRVFSKSVKEDTFSSTYIDQRTPGVIYEMRTEDAKACLYPRGVILHNGQKMIEAEDLRKVHETCDWATDIEQKMVDAGFPHFKLVERTDSICEDIYKEEEYYHIETYEESVRYLKMIGFSEEKINLLLGASEESYTESEQYHQQVKQMEKVIGKKDGSE